ncbi:hypothetical protein [Nonomuraea sp. 10N515B]
MTKSPRYATSGGWVGPKIARRMPGHSLRYLAALCGLAVALKLGWDSYAR